VLTSARKHGIWDLTTSTRQEDGGSPFSCQDSQPSLPTANEFCLKEQMEETPRSVTPASSPFSSPSLTSHLSSSFSQFPPSLLHQREARAVWCDLLLSGLGPFRAAPCLSTSVNKWQNDYEEKCRIKFEVILSRGEKSEAPRFHIHITVPVSQPPPKPFVSAKKSEMDS
jgi:hypothetical protein